MPPLVCTQNSLFHIDFGVPIVANKSSDYRTSTGKNCRYIPSIAQYFDCVSMIVNINNNYLL